MNIDLPKPNAVTRVFHALRELEEWDENAPLTPALTRAFDGLHSIDDAFERMTAKLALPQNAEPREVADALDIMLKRLQELEQKVGASILDDGERIGAVLPVRVDTHGRVVVSPESIEAIAKRTAEIIFETKE